MLWFWDYMESNFATQARMNYNAALLAVWSNVKLYNEI